MYIPIFLLVLLILFLVTFTASLVIDKEKKYYDFLLRAHSVYKLNRDDEIFNSIHLNHIKWRSKNFNILLLVTFFIFIYFTIYIFTNAIHFNVGDI